MTNPAIRVDMRGVTGPRKVTAFLGGFERLVSPYYGAAFYNCDVDVYFGGSTFTTGGYIYGDSSCTGMVAVPAYRLAGSLKPGVN